MAKKPTKPRRNGQGGTGPELWQSQFLASIRQYPNVLWAAKEAGTTRKTVYKRIKSNAEFRREFFEAKRLGILELERIAFERATKGLSDRVLLRLLEAHLPGKYARKSIDVNVGGQDGNPVSIESESVIRVVRETIITTHEQAQEARRRIAEKRAVITGQPATNGHGNGHKSNGNGKSK